MVKNVEFNTANHCKKLLRGTVEYMLRVRVEDCDSADGRLVGGGRSSATQTDGWHDAGSGGRNK